MHARIHHIPSSMQLSTVTPEEASEAVEKLQWLNQNVTDNSVLLVDEELRGYVSYYCDREQILVIDIGNPWYSTPKYLDNLLKKAGDLTDEGNSVYFLGRTFFTEELETISSGNMIQLYKYIP